MTLLLQSSHFGKENKIGRSLRDVQRLLRAETTGKPWFSQTAAFIAPTNDEIHEVNTVNQRRFFYLHLVGFH